MNKYQGEAKRMTCRICGEFNQGWMRFWSAFIASPVEFAGFVAAVVIFDALVTLVLRVARYLAGAQ